MSRLDYGDSWNDMASGLKPDADVEKKRANIKVIRRYGGDFAVEYDANAERTSSKAIDKSSPYIRNFTTQMRAYSPELNEFFDDFALDIVKPDSITWEDAEDGIRYETKYLCRGRMNTDSFEHNVRKVKITGKTVSEDMIEFTMSNLVLSVVVIELRAPEPQSEAKGFIGKLKSKIKK